MSKIAEWKDKAEAYKVKKEVELQEKKIQINAEINKNNKNNPENEKKPYSTAQLHKIYRFCVTWGMILMVLGMAMIIVGTAFMGCFGAGFPRDMGAAFLFWIVGMLFLGLGVGELLHSVGAREAILLREVNGPGASEGEKSGPLDEKT